MIVSFVINSINGGVNVTFTHDEGCTCGVPNPHTENISGDLVPFNDATALQTYLKDWARAYNEGKAAEAHDASAVQSIINTPITLE